MDSQRFDDLTKGLVSKRSRRDVVKGVAGAALAGVGVAGVARPASAATACNSGLIPSLFGALARIFSSLGIYFPGPPEPPECTGSTVLNPDTCECECALTDADCPGQTVVDVGSCECYCPLTVSDCPGGVDLDACTCEPIACDEGNPCGAAELDCNCFFIVENGTETSELTCVDRSGPNNWTCDSAADCEDGMVCVEIPGCSAHCVPLCGQAAAFSHIPDRLA